MSDTLYTIVGVCIILPLATTGVIVWGWIAIRFVHHLLKELKRGEKQATED
jgi:hypothetical protein